MPTLFSPTVPRKRDRRDVWGAPWPPIGDHCVELRFEGLHRLHAQRRVTTSHAPGSNVDAAHALLTDRHLHLYSSHRRCLHRCNFRLQRRNLRRQVTWHRNAVASHERRNQFPPRIQAGSTRSLQNEAPAYHGRSKRCSGSSGADVGPIVKTKRFDQIMHF